MGPPYMCIPRGAKGGTGFEMGAEASMDRELALAPFASLPIRCGPGDMDVIAKTLAFLRVTGFA